MTGILIKRESSNTDTHMGRTPCEDEGRDWGDASASQGSPKTASKPRRLGESPGPDSSLLLWKEPVLPTP